MKKTAALSLLTAVMLFAVAVIAQAQQPTKVPRIGFLGTSSASALAALPAGRAMDRFGRVPVIAVGFVFGAIGYSLAAAGTHWRSGVALR